MKAREANKGAPSADLLVCFPSRAHLTLLPKPICSPARPVEPSKRHHNHSNRHLRHRHRLKKSSTRGGSGGQASPLLWAKNKQMGSEISSEPTSPKVTCAGQIKVRHKTVACKSWQSVMEEIERIHNNRKHKKRSSWMDSLGFKKDIMQFLTCLRNIRFDFRCFGSIPQTDITTDEDEEDEEDEEFRENHGGSGASDGNEGSSTMFSKWFMVLQENQNTEFCREKRKDKEKEKPCNDEPIATPSVPPPNALLLMRCRSAPAKSWLEEKVEEREEDEEEVENDDEEEEEKEEEEDRKTEEKKGRSLEALMEEEKRNMKKESLVVMRYDTNFYKISSDIAKETWVVGGMRDPLSRSRSWKR
uniref:ARID domain-containing protein n=1 Tax=Manihot esculenta TaxID=3983 RepID=A0A2C9U1A4_MANES